MSRYDSNYRRDAAGYSRGSNSYHRDMPFDYEGFGQTQSTPHASNVQQHPYGYQPSQHGAQPLKQGSVGYSQHVRPSSKQQGGRSGGKLTHVVALLVGLVLGAVAMLLFTSFTPHVPNPVSPTLSERQLDSVVGTYVFAGDVYEVTARDAILGSTSLASRLNTDGTYDAPSADMVLSYARNQILNELVASNGIVVTEAEVASYAQSVVGSSDMAYVAQYFGMDEAQAKSTISEAAAVSKLRRSVESGQVGAPVPPAVPADGNVEVGTPAYATYIIGLLGAYWDSVNGTWADTNNAYYWALSDKVFALDSANYEAAQAAYAVAYEQYSQASSSSSAWLDYVNGYLQDAAITIATLGA